MSSIGATSSIANLSQAGSTAKTAPVASTATPVQTRATLRPDTVTLSILGQAKLLHQQGDSPALIATSLGIKVADVDGYLGIKVAVPTAPTPAPSEATSASTSEPVAAARTEAPEATVQPSPAPKPVASKP